VYVSDRVVVLGGRPAGVRRIVEVPLGRERDQLTTKSDSRFLSCRNQVLAEIRSARADG
jgi:NitT/TauT family transport system ATP-binding protein